MGHELGHNFGAHHANSYMCLGNNGFQPFTYDCESNEYGDYSGIMGSSSGHHTAEHKWEIGWLSDQNVITAKEGTYSIKPLEIKQTDDSIQMI
ncbi:MAG: hypothetical protein HY848_16785, partial [Betaproteobacteria bacterium]|nr:hypothetical protein [Betaproteobacteria bacterium]